jgi:SAM-dependent MidA family methyltransferase
VERGGAFGDSAGAQGSVPEVEAAVRGALRARGGRITFAEFMQVCLYLPDHGYYAGFGPRSSEGARAPAADYFTSVDLHPAFGRLLAREAAHHLDRAGEGRAGPLWVVELGAGRGLLARDVLQALALERGDLARRVRYLIVEPNLGWLEVQRRALLPEFEGVVSWVRGAGVRLPLRRVVGAFLSNELFDALPFHVVEGGPEVREVFIEEGEGGALREALGPVQDPRVSKRLELEGITLERGQRAEVGLEAAALGEAMAEALAKGGLIAVDYGDEAEALYDPQLRPQGTLRAFFRHRLNDEPLARMGAQDLTAHVDFTALAAAVARGGAAVRRLERQSDFLARHGLDAVRAKLESDQPGLPREVYVRHRRALEALVDPKGLGRNVVLVAWR